MMQLKFGLIGLEEHVRFILGDLKKISGLELVGIVEKDKKRHSSLKEEYKVPIYSDYQELFRQQEMQVVGICTPNNEKAEIILTCIAKGKHMITDKPLLTTMEDLKKVEEASRRSPKIKLSMLLTLRGTPSYRAVKGIIEEGKIGKIVSCYAKRSYRLRRESRPDWIFKRESSGCAMVEMAIHDIDIIRWITQTEVSEITAYHSNAGYKEEKTFEDNGQILLRMGNGIIAYIEHNRLIPKTGASSDNRLSIIGTEGIVEITQEDKVFLWTNEKPRHEVFLPETKSIFIDFIESIRENRNSIVTKDDIIISTRVSLLARESADQRKTVKIS